MAGIEDGNLADCCGRSESIWKGCNELMVYEISSYRLKKFVIFQSELADAMSCQALTWLTVKSTLLT